MRNTNSSDPVARFREMLLIYHQRYQIFGVMRMTALRKIPPQGAYVNGDGVLLARMSLLGRFHEVPEPLFISRRHVGQSMPLLPARLGQPRFSVSWSLLDGEQLAARQSAARPVARAGHAGPLRVAAPPPR